MRKPKLGGVGLENENKNGTFHSVNNAFKHLDCENELHCVPAQCLTVERECAHVAVDVFPSPFKHADETGHVLDLWKRGWFRLTVAFPIPWETLYGRQLEGQHWARSACKQFESKSVLGQ